MRREKGPSFLLCSRSLHRLQASFHFRFCSRIQTRRETELSSVSIKLSDIKVAGVAEIRGEIQDFRPVPEEASGRWGGKKKGRDRRLWSTSGGRLKKSGAFLSSCIGEEITRVKIWVVLGSPGSKPRNAIASEGKQGKANGNKRK
ncbi:hypothetical protein RchiOBHm_Chr3g0447691 [Rosa chinensis]|uniref:Uncharacterized protein n=1 Tax=Rosa chinensis TaxID=74649 RepID=A0A2P6R4Z9_ROSCH|nr:hypothetical protein RchiOBHm_Chr3g0447691 [Rosa chinensis]